MCIVGGSSLCLTPELFVAFTNLGVLSPNGQCKPFDKQADGYARGEGITCVVLTTLKLAKEKNYKIYCEVKASGIAHDGHKTSITTPSSKEQQNLIEKVFNKFHIDKETIDYFEAHGTGTSVGDPLELMAISNTFSSKLKPIRVGSVKGNIGHTEYSAGLASVIKVALMIYYKQLLPTNNFNELTTKMNFNNIEIQNELESFSLNDKITCCINSFGFGGSNSHVVLQSIEQNEEYCLEEQQKSILMLSAHSPSSLIETCKKWKEFCLNKTNDNLFQTSILQAFGRSIYKYKVAFDFQSNEQLLQLLDLFIKDQQEEIINTRIHHNLIKKDKVSNKIAFVFCGQGHHYLSMGTWLYNNINVFKLKVDDCDEIIYQLTGKYLIKEYNLFTDKCKLTEEQFSSGPIFIPVTLTTILQIGLLELLKSWNIVPDVVLGHSIGDIIAAYACGAIALRETLKIVIIRTN
jgi:acyl transferase domain-containing protein